MTMYAIMGSKTRKWVDVKEVGRLEAIARRSNAGQPQQQGQATTFNNTNQHTR
jgi:hypothetical protein